MIVGGQAQLRIVGLQFLPGRAGLLRFGECRSGAGKFGRGDQPRGADQSLLKRGGLVFRRFLDKAGFAKRFLLAAHFARGLVQVRPRIGDMGELAGLAQDGSHPGFRGGGLIESAVLRLPGHLPRDAERGRDLQFLDVPVLRRKLAGKVEKFLRHRRHAKIFQERHPHQLEQMGIVERFLQALEKGRVLVGDRDVSAGRAGLVEFLDPLVDHAQRPGAEDIALQSVNGQEIDPGLRIEGGK